MFDWFESLSQKQLPKTRFFGLLSKGAFMKVIGYIRVSSEMQDLLKQEHLLLKYA